METVKNSFRTVSFVIPVHNEAALVRRTAGIIQNWQLHQYFEEVRIIFIENGSNDNSYKEIEKVVLENSNSDNNIKILGLSESQAGIGYAYSRGITEAIRNFESSPNHWIVLSACDLPFSNSDIESYIRYSKNCPDNPIYIGSKAHKDSKAGRGWLRALIGSCFGILRFLLLGLKIGDTQGSFIIRSDIAQELNQQILARDFGFTTELCFLASKQGLKIIEIPIILSQEVRPSTVRPIKDSIRVLKVLLRLWRSSLSR